MTLIIDKAPVQVQPIPTISLKQIKEISENPTPTHQALAFMGLEGESISLLKTTFECMAGSEELEKVMQCAEEGRPYIIHLKDKLLSLLVAARFKSNLVFTIHSYTEQEDMQYKEWEEMPVVQKEFQCDLCFGHCNGLTYKNKRTKRVWDPHRYYMKLDTSMRPASFGVSKF